MLNIFSSSVRQELANQRVTNLVPHIRFKLDQSASKGIEAIQILNDLGLSKTKADREMRDDGELHHHETSK